MKFLIILFIASASVNSIEASYVYYEKVDYEIYNKSVVSDINFKIKRTAYNTYEGYLNGIIHESFDELWVHFILYNKKLKYQKYFVDIWLEICGIIKQPCDNPMGLFLLGTVLIHRFDFESNSPVHCPTRTGLKYINTIRPINLTAISVPHIPGVPLLQDGQYRLDVTLATKRNGNVFLKAQFYGSIIS